MPNERTGTESGKPDDRLLFTEENATHEYKAIAALAAAGRVLKATGPPSPPSALPPPRPFGKPSARRRPMLPLPSHNGAPGRLLEHASSPPSSSGRRPATLSIAARFSTTALRSSPTQPALRGPLPR